MFAAVRRYTFRMPAMPPYAFSALRQLLRLLFRWRHA